MSSSTQELHSATTELPVSAALTTRWLALAVLLTGAFLPILDFTIVNLALPSIRQNLGASSAQVQFESVGGTGRLGTVRFIQRTETRGGNAPDVICSQGAMLRVPYTATYSFYEAGH